MATFSGDGFELSLPESCADAVKMRLGANVELGIRPEDLTPTDSGGIAGQVRLVEALGNEQLVYVDVGSRSVIARYDSHALVRPGQPMWLLANPRKLHIFDCESGRNLLNGSRFDPP